MPDEPGLYMEGHEQLVALGRRLREFGDGGHDGVISTFRREMNADTKGLRKRARDRIRQQLPHRGGLNTWVGKLPSTSVKVERDRASVKVTSSKRGHDFEAINRGRVRHRVFGRGWAKKTQTVTAGWWEKALEPEAADLTDRLSYAVQRAIARAVRIPGSNEGA